MAMQKKAIDVSPIDEADSSVSFVEETIEARRMRRMAVLQKVAGIWAHRPDIPADGLDYQRELRAEWR